MICKISDRLRYRKAFYAQNQCILVEDGQGREGEYYLIQSKSTKGSYICPSCGNEAPLEQLIDGCDYCQTKFHIEDLKQKVSFVYLPDNRMQERSGGIMKSFYILIYVFVIIMAFFVLNLAPQVSFFLVPAILAVFLFVIFLKVGKHSVTEGPGRNKKTLEKLRKTDSYFSEEYFIGNLSNKLISIHYATNMGDINAFVYCDLSSLLPRYRGILYCKLIKCVMTDYEEDEQLKHLYLDVTVSYAEVGAGRVRANLLEDIKLHMIKSKATKTNIENDVMVYRCKSCGASISLLNGGKCPYCQSNLELYKYDWVIQEYQVVPRK